MRRFCCGITTMMLFLMLTPVSWILAQEKDEILAKVGNEVITRLDFETRLKSFPAAAQGGLNDFEKRKQLLDNMIKARLFVLEGESKGLTENADIKAKLRMMRDDFITQEYTRAYIEKKAEVSNEEAEKYYNTDPEMREREYLKVSQIVLESEKEAKRILERLKEGENFKKLAMENSIDPTSKKLGGELEWFEKGKKEKEIEEALAKIGKGETSDVVKVNGKNYIFKLDERNVLPKIPYLKVKDEIIKGLRYKKITELAEKEVEELKKKITSEVFYDKLTSETK
jgi:peptidyl-prolyl cis-trans isomerase C